MKTADKKVRYYLRWVFSTVVVFVIVHIAVNLFSSIYWEFQSLDPWTILIQPAGVSLLWCILWPVFNEKKKCSHGSEPVSPHRRDSTRQGSKGGSNHPPGN